MLGVIQDITELTSNERVQEDTLHLWNIVLNSIPIMIFTKDVDNDYRYTMTNKCFEKFMGYSRQELLGHTDYELFKDKAAARHFRTWDEKIVAKG